MSEIIDLTDDNDIVEINPVLKNKKIELKTLRSNKSIINIDKNNSISNSNLIKSSTISNDNDRSDNTSKLWNIGRKRRYENNINNSESLIEPSLVDVKEDTALEADTTEYISTTIYNTEIKELYNLILSELFINVDNLNRDYIFI